MEFLTGILCGVVLSLLFSFGPAFFGLIQNSIQHGFKRATAFVFGISISDIIVVFLMLTVLKNVDVWSLMHNLYVGCIAGIGIIAIGIFTFRKKAKVERNRQGRLKFKTDGSESTGQLLLHGFVLNTLNPFIWLYWISVITLLSGEINLEVGERYIFFAGLLIAALGVDMLKCRLASLLQKWFTARVLNIFNRLMGIILIGFGIYMIVSTVVYQVDPVVREKEQNATPQSTKMIQQVRGHIGRDTSHRGDTLYLK